MLGLAILIGKMAKPSPEKSQLVQSRVDWSTFQFQIIPFETSAYRCMMVAGYLGIQISDGPGTNE